MSEDELHEKLKQLKINREKPDNKDLNAGMEPPPNIFYGASSSGGNAKALSQLCAQQMQNGSLRNLPEPPLSLISPNYGKTLSSHKNPLAAKSSKELLREPVLGVHKKALKKQTQSTNRKAYLRKPLLNALETNVPTQSLMAVPTTADIISPVRMCLTGGKGSTVGGHGGGMNDFRDMIKECQNLLENSETGVLLQPATKPFGKDCRTNKFNLNEGSAAGSRAWRKGIGGRERLQAHAQSANSLDNSPSSRPSTSTCSQQAGNNILHGCDDVTIDELAGYFDTLVHIPKKMSQMAEMMYI